MLLVLLDDLALELVTNLDMPVEDRKPVAASDEEAFALGHRCGRAVPPPGDRLLLHKSLPTSPSIALLIAAAQYPEQRDLHTVRPLAV